MTQEEKDLLLKDLCTRLPHGVIITTPQGDGHLNEVSLTIFGHELGVNIKATERTRFKLEECKPYLRPMSSMTYEEKEKFRQLASLQHNYLWDGVFYTHWRMIDWLLENHFDFRCLIPMGLALEAPKGMYN